jgi:hypothetical protein
LSEQQQEAQLTLKDRLNFPYILANQILTFQKSLLALEYSEQEIRESIEGFVHLIPQSWKDKQFEDDLESAKTKQKIDKRPIVAGNLRISEETCKSLGIEPFEEKEVVDYYKVFQACIDLLNRRDLISKKKRIEKLVEIDLDNIGENEILESDLSS